VLCVVNVLFIQERSLRRMEYLVLVFEDGAWPPKLVTQ